MADHQGLDKMDFFNLPPVVIVNILQHLAYPDFKIARLVCWNWYNASLLADQDKLVLYVNDECKFKPSDLLQSKRDVFHLSFDNALKNITETWLTHTAVWSQQGPMIKSVCLHSCKFNEEQLLEGLKHCITLKYLKIWSCDIESSVSEIPNDESDEHFDHLPKDAIHPRTQFLQLQDLHFCSSKCCTEDFKLFKTLMSMSPNLKSLTVKCQKYAPASIEEQQKYYETVASYLENGADVKELVFCMENDEDEEAGQVSIPDRLLSAPTLRLRKLEVKAALIEKTLTQQKEWLEDLELWVTMFLNPNELDIIPRELRRLKRLKMLFRDGEASCVRHFASLKNLVVLDLSFDPAHHSWGVKETDIVAGLCSAVNTTMKELMLSFTGNLSEKCISEICRTHLALTRLEFGGLNGVTNVSVQSIFYYLVLLQTLYIEFCGCFSDDGISGVNTLESGNQLVIDGYSFPVGYSITRLKDLRLLRLSYCNVVKGVPFKDGLKLPALREAEFTSESLTQENLVCFVENHPLLKRLEVKSATDNLIKAIVSNLTCLKFIKIWDHSQVSAESMQMLREHCRVVRCTELGQELP